MPRPHRCLTSAEAANAAQLSTPDRAAILADSAIGTVMVVAAAFGVAASLGEVLLPLFAGAVAVALLLINSP